MTDIAKLNIEINSSKAKQAKTDLDQLTRSGQNTEKGMGTMSAAARKLGVALAAAFSFQQIISKTSQAVREFANFERQMLRLEAQIKATGRTGQTTAADMERMAQAIDKATLQSAQGVRSAQALLMSFRNVSTDMMERILYVAADVAEVMGQDITSAARQMALALEDPERGITMLRRTGTTFTESQKEMIIQLQNTGKELEAQSAILEVMEGQYGGTAKAAADGLAGSLDLLSRNATNLKVVLGEQLAPAVEQLVLKLANLLEMITKAFAMPDYLEQLTKIRDRMSSLQAEADKYNKKLADGTRFTQAFTNKLDRVNVELDILREKESFLRLDMAKTGVVNVSDLNTAINETNESLKEIPDHIKKAVSSLEDIRAQARLDAFFGEIDAYDDLLYEKEQMTINAEESLKQIRIQKALDGYFEDADNYDQLQKDKTAAYEKAAKEVESIWDELNKTSEFSFASDDLSEFANIMNAVENITDAYKDQAKMLERINALKEEGSITAIEATEMEAVANENMVSDSLKGYSNLFGTLGQFFDENSKEREAMHNAEMAFTAIEIALGLKKAITNAIASVASQGQGDPYTAFARVAAMAAMMGALLSQIGGSINSGGGGSASAPKAHSGTVLGSDEASQSFQNSLERFEDLEEDQYVELQKIHSELVGISNALSGVADSIVRSVGEFGAGTFAGLDLGTEFGVWSGPSRGIADAWYEVGNAVEDALGGVLGGLIALEFNVLGWAADFLGSAWNAVFGGDVSADLGATGIQIAETTMSSLLAGIETGVQQYAEIKYKEDGGWFSDSKWWNEIVNQPASEDTVDLFGQIYEQTADVLVLFADSFGKTVSDIEDYTFELQRINLKGLSGEEIQERLSEWYSEQLDLAVDAMFGDELRGYQSIDEGLFETASRLITENEVVSGSLESLGFVLSQTGMDLIEFTQSMVNMAGSLDSFAESTANFYDEFFSDEEKQSNRADYLNDLLDWLDMSLPETADGFKELVLGLDLMTESGRAAYVALTGAADTVSEYYDYLNSVEAETKSFESWRRGIAGISDLDAAFEKFGITVEDIPGILEAAATLSYEQIVSIADSLGMTRNELQEWISVLNSFTVDDVSGIRRDYVSALRDAWNQVNDAYTDARTTLEDVIYHEERLIDARREAARGIEDFIAGLEGSTRAPVQSMEFFEGRYAQLLGEAQTAEGEDIPGAVQNLQNFIGQYLDFAGAYGGDYATLFDSVTGDLEGLGEDIMTGADADLERLTEIRDEIGFVEDSLTDIETALGAYFEAEAAIDTASWMRDELIHLDEIAGSTADLYTLMYDYYAATGGILPGSAGDFGDGDVTGSGGPSGGVVPVRESGGSVDVTGSSGPSGPGPSGYGLGSLSFTGSEFRSYVDYMASSGSPEQVYADIIGAGGTLAQFVRTYNSVYGERSSKDDWMRGYFGPAGIDEFADGGISTGPTSGYPAMLHGTEAVIPLNSGSIPVEIRGGGTGDIKVIVKIGNRELTDITTEIIRTDPEAQREVRRVANG